MKIYISGQISNIPYEHAKEKFKWTKTFLIHKGYTVVSPIDITKYEDGKKWESYMKECIHALMTCDAIYMLPCWANSKGAKMEYRIAKKLKMKIFYKGEI